MLSTIRQRFISKTYTHVKILTQNLNLDDLLSCLNDGALSRDEILPILGNTDTGKLILPFIR